MRAGLLALGTIVGIGACSPAMAQKMPDVQATRDMTIGAAMDVIYNSNVARTNPTLAALRSVHPQDETVRPSAHFSIVQPIGRQAVFLKGFAGYDFHRENKQLNRQNADLTGGGIVTTGPCHTTLFGRYAAAQSDLADVTLGTVKNTLTTIAEGGGLACGSGRGLGGQISGQHSETTNSGAIQDAADHTVDGGQASISYGRPSLGTLALTGNYSQQRFPNQIDFNGHKGDEYWSQMLGVDYQRAFGSKINVTASVGVNSLKRQSAPPGVPLSSSTTGYAAQVTYKMSDRLGFSLTAQRAYLPSNRPGKLYDLTTSAEGFATYHLGTRFVVTLGGVIDDIVSNQDTAVAAPLTPTKSRRKSVYTGLSYQQSQRASIALNVRQEDRKADLASFDYSDTRATLSLAVNF